MDGFYLKTEFKISAIFALVGVVLCNAINLTYSPSPEFPFSAIILFATILALFTTSTLYPLSKTYAETATTTPEDVPSEKKENRLESLYVIDELRALINMNFL